jgi:hypothetical protein
MLAYSWKTAHLLCKTFGLFMTELDQLIQTAFASEGKQDDVNKVYLALLRASLFLPVEKISSPALDNEEPFKPLFAQMDEKYFMLAFDTLERLTAWAGDQFDLIDYVEIAGKELIAGMNEQVFLCFNVGTPFYKEFSPDEVKQLKKIVARIDQLRQSN